jgi:hypoxanthine phosphoribosyltransferase
LTANLDYEVSTWSQVYKMLLRQAQKIQTQPYKPDVIVGIAKGGMVPARVLVDLLETAELVMIQVEFYVGIGQTALEPTLRQALALDVSDRRLLLVDDIVDTGNTLKLAKNYVKQQGALEVKTATLYTKPYSITTPDFFERQTSRWVVFPWDTKETLRRIIQMHQNKRTESEEIGKLVKAGLPKKLTEKLLKAMR